MSDGVVLSKSFIMKISCAVALVHLVIISYMGYADLNNFTKIKMSKEANKMIVYPDEVSSLDINRETL